jgi:hypothetical protein
MEFDWRTDWKRPAIWGAAFGVAATLTLLVGLALIHWYTSRPKAWNADAIKGINTTAVQTFGFDDSDKVSKFKGSGFSISFIVENKTGKDFALQQDSKFFKREAKSQALEEIKLSIEHPYVIPAHERAEVVASMESSCREENLATGITRERDGKECFQDALGDVSEFVVYDYDSRIRLNLPKPAFYAGAESTPKTPINGIAPDNAKPWDEYWACSEAQRLTPICKQSKIELDQAQASAGGWTPVGALPTLVRPPKGYVLDASAETCKIMYQWDYYCGKKGTTK